MPFPIAAAIGAGASLLGGGVDAIATGAQNRKQRKWSEHMYERQVADNIAFWNLQNAYNSPQEQMKRFQAAGLNPHLIYGQGNAGNAGPVPTPDVQPVNYRTPEWGRAISTAGLTYMNAIYDLDIKQAQVNNMEVQNEVLKREVELKRAQALATMTSEERARFNLEFEREFRETSGDLRREELRQKRVSTDLSINKDAREAALNSSHLLEAVERMASSREQRAKSRIEREQIRETISNLRRTGTLQRLDIQLRKKGINPQDPMWAQIVGRILSNMFDEDGRYNNTKMGSFWQWLFK